MAPARKNGSKKLLSSSRPAVNSTRISKPMSSKTTRTLIRSHHNLHKQLKQAQTSGDQAKIAELQNKITSLGGIDAYQKASIHGQSVERGGDSSKVLIQWLQELGVGASKDVLKGDCEDGTQGVSEQPKGAQKEKLRLLEVGSLSPHNACARSGLFKMVRIDLNSQHPEIQQQDFMERPVPRGLEALEHEGFDVVSLSLVVNYVPDAEGRGAMLRRVSQFLRRAGDATVALPGLFLVLPAPCVTNSRYLDETRLVEVMRSLGFSLLKSKITSKLVYYYYSWVTERKPDTARFPKKELRQGRQMNNFAIVLK